MYELNWVKVSKEQIQELIQNNPTDFEGTMKECVEDLKILSKGRYFFPKEWDIIWHTNCFGGISSIRWFNDNEMKQKMVHFYGVFDSEEKAVKMVEKQKALVRIWKYVQENGMYFEPDWRLWKTVFSIGFDFDEWLLEAYWTNCVKKQLSLPYFKNRNDALDVIDNCVHDLEIIFDL